MYIISKNKLIDCNDFIINTRASSKKHRQRTLLPPVLTNNTCYSYLFEIISRKETSVNTVRANPIIYAAPCEWNKLSERQILIVSRSVLKQCYLYSNMELTENNNYYCYFCCNNC